MTARLELPPNLDGGKEPSGGSVGPAGPGVPVGGTTGQGLAKTSNSNYATTWADFVSLLVFGEVANEVADLVAALGNPDQIAWGAEWDAAGLLTGASGDQFLAFLASLPGGIGDAVQVETDARIQDVAGLAALNLDVADRVDTAQAAADAAGTTADAATVLAAAASAAVAAAEANIALLYHIQFDANAATITPIGNTGFDAITLSALSLTGAVRTSDGVVNRSVIFPVAGQMYSAGGLWTFTMTHVTGSDVGIYSIETTDDGGATWDVKATVDGYAAVPASAQTVVTGIAVAPLNDSVRVRMGAKNVLSSSFVGRLAALSGYFVFT